MAVKRKKSTKKGISGLWAGKDAKADDARVYSQQEEQSMDIDYVPPEPQRQERVSTWIRISLWGLFIFVMVSEIFTDPAGSSGQVAGYNYVQLIFMGVFTALFSELCAKLAMKIGKNMDFAYAIGFLFGLIGFATYGLYYFAVKRKNSRPDIGKLKAGRKSKK
jgi:hypothetical protein